MTLKIHWSSSAPGCEIGKVGELTFFRISAAPGTTPYLVDLFGLACPPGRESDVSWWVQKSARQAKSLARKILAGWVERSSC